MPMPFPPQATPSLARPAGPPRPRTDPHEDYRARVRRELRDGAAPSLRAPRAAPDLPLRRVAADAPLVLVVLPATVWPGAAEDLLGGAREIAPDGRVLLASFGAPGCSPAAAGADLVCALPAAGTEEEALALLLALISHHAPAHVILPEDGAGADLARRLAARLGFDSLFGVAAAPRRGQLVVPARGGRAERLAAPAPLMTLARSACAPVPGTHRYAAEPCAAPPAEAPPRGFLDAGELPRSAADLSLTEADLVLGAGAGVHAWDLLRAVGQAMGAAIAGSRVVCDAGHLPRSRQVGASGHLIEAEGYLALGISGAPQHLQGIAACRHVIAVNTDRHAPIMARADLAVVGDAQEILAELGALLEAGA